MTGYLGQSQQFRQPITRVWVYCPDCGKRRYPTRKGAKIVLKELVRDGTKASDLSVYECPVVDGWFHVGHKPWYKR